MLTSTRRRPRTARAAPVAVLAIVLALVLGACGGAAEPEPAAAPEPGFPVTIPHAFGETTVPTRPTRVVTVGYNDADFALALGVVPVGVRDFIGSFDETTRPWAQEALGGAVPELVGGNEVDVERVAALAPDLILGVYSYMDQATYDALSAIAPTVADPQAGAAVAWQDQARITGQALGEPVRADEVVADVEQRFADARAAHPQFASRTLSIALGVGDETVSLGADDLRSQPFTGLGFAGPPTTETLATERLGELDGEGLAVFGVDEATARTNPVFATLPAVVAERTVFLGDESSAFAGAIGFGSPLSLSYALDVMVPPLAETYR